MNKTLILGIAGVAVLLGGAIGLRVAIAPKSSNGPAISLWVGNEDGNVEFYQSICDEYIATLNEEEPGSFPYSVKVSGTDLGGIASSILQDASAAADIYSVANDNVGKLAQNGKSRPITDQSLIDAVHEDNTEAIVNVCNSKVKGTTNLYGVPYISQALFLMYDKRYVSEDQAKTFEGLREAAIARGSNVKGVEVTGTDGFNFCFPLLARENESKATTLKIYENGTRKDGTWAQGDDTVAVTKWTRDYYADPNGLGFPSDAKWDGDLKAGKTNAVIGGAWHYNAFAKSIGSDNAGVTVIPTMTMTAKSAFGDVHAGDVYRGGTFADVKVFMLNTNCSDEKMPYAQKLMKYLSSRKVQDDSFIDAGNIPAYSAFADRIDTIKTEHPEIPDSVVSIASAQAGMNPYGLPQPFITALLNNFYYQNGGPAVYQEIIVNKDGAFDADRKVQEGLYNLQWVWQNGERFKGEYPATLPAQIVVD